MAAKHTPGPWHPATLKEAPEAGLIVCDAEGGSICDCVPPGPWISDDVGRANARLIAAAPELLDALKQAALELGEAANILKEHFPNAASLFSLVDRARAGIAKAEGTP